ncbi:RidA family protein [Halobaculum lipolyticum]|uniref:RidA family protein n=1 Tax=Halobaculum lipolyticum TaxID=3032001 RepID=A0ABD5WAW6_9EURY|nr:RidA family protein [Halobaculum sp. DT31]
MNRRHVSTGTEWERTVGYSRAVRVGDRVEVSGTTATDEDGAVVGVDDARAQTRRAIENVERGLRAAGASLADVVRTRVYVTDIDRWEAVGRAHGEAFGDVRPASTMVEVSGLIDPEMLVEVEAVAVVGAVDDDAATQSAADRDDPPEA